MNTITEQIKQLEEKLLHSDVIANRSIFDELLADDFEEIASNGRISSRQQVVEWLVNKDKNIRWMLLDFKVRQLTPDLVLAVYRAKKSDGDHASNGSLRSSLWKRNDSHWQMTFHQASKILT